MLLPLLLLPFACAVDSDETADTAGGAEDEAPGAEDSGTAEFASADVRFNELMADYVNGVPEQSGDWVEVVNLSDEPVALNTLYVTLNGNFKSAELLCERTVGNTVAPLTQLESGDHLLVSFGKGMQDTEACFASITLRRYGGTITLYGAGTDPQAPEITALDVVTWPQLLAPYSWARTPDGVGEWAQDGTPTPGASNDD